MKKKILVDVKVTCELPSDVGRYCKTLERKADAMEEWITDFTLFMRDHRSQDSVSLDIERIYEERCEFCEYEQEEDENGIPVCCKKAQEEFLSKKENEHLRVTL